MAQVHDLTDAQSLLLATTLATESDLTRLQVLAAEKQHVLDRTLLYRLLLTFLPANDEIQGPLTTFLRHSLRDFHDVSTLDTTIDTSSVTNVSETEIRERLHAIRLDTLADSPEYNGDSVTSFLVQWVHRVETISGITSSVLSLVDAFAEDQQQLQRWRDTYLVPLILLQNEFYPGQADTVSLEVMENLHGQVGVKTLLEFAERSGEHAEIGRDLNLVVAPWVRGAQTAKRRKLDQPPSSRAPTTWRDIDQWIYNISATDFQLAAKAVMQWNGPDQANSHSSADSDEYQASQIHYVQTALALLLRPTENYADAGPILSALFERATALSIANGADQSSASADSLASASRADLTADQLLDPANPITKPSDECFIFVKQCLDAKDVLGRLQLNTDVSTIAEIALFGSEDKQKQELAHILQQLPQLTKSGVDWRQVRNDLHSLRGSGKQSTVTTIKPSFHYLGRIPTHDLESGLLHVILNAGRYDIAKELYLPPTSQPLAKDIVKDHVVQAIFEGYDNASNGNRTRGGIKRASDLLEAFSPSFDSTQIFSNIGHLIKATHSLSFYQLTLRHGVPFRPVNIRVYKDPLALIEKVLEQNPKAYTKLDDLLDIARNIVQAGTAIEAEEAFEPAKSVDEKLFDAEHRVIFQAIATSLSDLDFDTAYSYITTRLSTDPTLASSSPYVDDTSWRAAYIAGKYRPRSMPKTLHERIQSLYKRMDLLSLALVLAPTQEPLPEILATWRRSEEEMDNLRSEAIEEERAFEAQGSDVIPGGFGPVDRELDAAETRRLMDKRATGGFSATYEEEAPMGLFDVARGAASAFRQSAFPLGNSSSGSQRGPFIPTANKGPDVNEESLVGGQQSVRRKRDVVSGIVTGGLVSGMSWVLGASPASQGSQHDTKHAPA